MPIRERTYKNAIIDQIKVSLTNRPTSKFLGWVTHHSVNPQFFKGDPNFKIMLCKGGFKVF